MAAAFNTTACDGLGLVLSAWGYEITKVPGLNNEQYCNCPFTVAIPQPNTRNGQLPTTDCLANNHVQEINIAAPPKTLKKLPAALLVGADNEAHYFPYLDTFKCVQGCFTGSLLLLESFGLLPPLMAELDISYNNFASLSWPSNVGLSPNLTLVEFSTGLCCPNNTQYFNITPPPMCLGDTGPCLSGVVGPPKSALLPQLQSTASASGSVPSPTDASFSPASVTPPDNSLSSGMSATTKVIIVAATAGVVVLLGALAAVYLTRRSRLRRKGSAVTLSSVVDRNGHDGRQTDDKAMDLSSATNEELQEPNVDSAYTETIAKVFAGPDRILIKQPPAHRSAGAFGDASASGETDTSFEITPQASAVVGTGGRGGTISPLGGGESMFPDASSVESNSAFVIAVHATPTTAVPEGTGNPYARLQPPPLRPMMMMRQPPPVKGPLMPGGIRYAYGRANREIGPRAALGPGRLPPAIAVDKSSDGTNSAPLVNSEDASAALDVETQPTVDTPSNSSKET